MKGRNLKSIKSKDGAPEIPDPCYRCRFFSGILLEDENDIQESESNVYCEAFPEGIPEVIQNGKNNHSKPLSGQKNKITFEAWGET